MLHPQSLLGKTSGLNITLLPNQALLSQILNHPPPHSLMYSQSITATRPQIKKTPSSLSTNSTIPLEQKDVIDQKVKWKTEKVLGSDDGGKKKSLSVCSLKKVNLLFQSTDSINRPKTALSQAGPSSFEARQSKRMVKNKSWTIRSKKGSDAEEHLKGTLLSAKRMGLLVDEGKSKVYLHKLIQTRRKATHFLEYDNSYKYKRQNKPHIWL